MKPFWKYITEHWKFGKDETDEELNRRILRESNAVVRNVSSPHWEALCNRLSGEMLEELARLYFEMQQGKVPSESLPARLSPIFATVLLMRRTKAMLLEGEVAEVKLKKILADKAEQAEYPPSVEPALEHNAR